MEGVKFVIRRIRRIPRIQWLQNSIFRANRYYIVATNSIFCSHKKANCSHKSKILGELGKLFLEKYSIGEKKKLDTYIREMVKKKIFPKFPGRYEDDLRICEGEQLHTGALRKWVDGTVGGPAECGVREDLSGCVYGNEDGEAGVLETLDGVKVR